MKEIDKIVTILELRDYFAAHAPITWEIAIKSLDNALCTYDQVARRISQMRFAYAEEMLKVRDKK